MTPLNGATLEDRAPGVAVLMVGTAGILTWETGALEKASEAALEAVTTAEKAGTRDSASTKCGGGDYSWNSFDLLEEEEEEKKKRRRR
ncbi:unnamed protein product [Cuscuta epithymum]|uniref:Uncharacterized protein n=1 Tax=Cuscuta epithymum TaxID=186058 RepID=A0AAV0EHL1_9ASTE|nr:unnamed protein product [Cuscuta epithymum]